MILDFSLKTYCTLKMFLLSAQNRYVILSSYTEGHVKKIQVLILCLLLFLSLPKSRSFFGKFTEEQVLKSCLYRNNSLNPPAFGFCDSVSYDLEESIEFRAWLVGFWVYRDSKMQNISAGNLFFLCFWAAIMDLLITLMY